MVGIFVQSAGIHAFRIFLEFEVYNNVVFRDKTDIVFGSLESLFNGHLRHEVQIDVFGNIQYGFLDKICGIKGYIKMSRKTECFRVEWNKTEVYTRLVVYLKGIH